MKHLFNSGLMILLAISVLAFSGCEAGLTKEHESDNNITENTGGDLGLEDLSDNFSFSNIDKNIQKLKKAIQNLEANTQQQQSDSVSSLQSTIDRERNERIAGLSSLTGTVNTDRANATTARSNLTNTMNQLNDEQTKTSNGLSNRIGVLENRVGEFSSSGLDSRIDTIENNIGSFTITGLDSRIDTIENNIGSFTITGLDSRIDTLEGKAIEFTSEIDFLSITHAPVGTIAAWHKNMTVKSGASSPPIPEGWVECNGLPVDDPESIYHGKATPKLNSPRYSGNSRGLFLRGHTKSGFFEIDIFEEHDHTYSYPSFGTSGVDETGGHQVYRNHSFNDDEPSGLSGGDETRPANMSVVWIMRIK
ncbi:MAG: hypothetical protein GY754_22020 [bacterium]|nr:hypothetical protein [bacterium]